MLTYDADDAGDSAHGTATAPASIPTFGPEPIAPDLTSDEPLEPLAQTTSNEKKRKIHSISDNEKCDDNDQTVHSSIAKDMELALFENAKAPVNMAHLPIVRPKRFRFSLYYPYKEFCAYEVCESDKGHASDMDANGAIVRARIGTTNKFTFALQSVCLLRSTEDGTNGWKVATDKELSLVRPAGAYGENCDGCAHIDQLCIEIGGGRPTFMKKIRQLICRACTPEDVDAMQRYERAVRRPCIVVSIGDGTTEPIMREWRQLDPFHVRLAKTSLVLDHIGHVLRLYCGKNEVEMPQCNVYQTLHLVIYEFRSKVPMLIH